jgi:hypothetical protein
MQIKLFCIVRNSKCAAVTAQKQCLAVKRILGCFAGIPRIMANFASLVKLALSTYNKEDTVS